MAIPILDEMLLDCAGRGGSALYIHPGRPPRIRIEGEMRAIRPTPLSREDTQGLLYEGLTKAQQKELTQQLHLFFVHRVLGFDGAFIAFRSFVGLADSGTYGLFCRTPMPETDPGVSAAVRATVDIERFHRTAKPDVGTGEQDDDHPIGGGRFPEDEGGVPVLAGGTSRAPVRRGRDAKPIPRAGEIDDNPAA